MTLIYEGLRHKEIQGPLTIPLTIVAKFVARAEVMEHHLEFALACHTDKEDTRRFLTAIEDAIAIIRRKKDVFPALGIVESTWRQSSEAVLDTCREAWELYTYLVFLDVKGDRALIEQVVHQLRKLVHCSYRGLLSALSRTQSWAEDALHEFGARGCSALLERRHTQALFEWQTTWRQRTEALCSKKTDSVPKAICGVTHGTEFWDHYFKSLFKIAWPDFAEAFAVFYLNGRCPVDIRAQLRTMVDPKSRNQVSRAVWQRVAQGTMIWDLVGNLTAEVQSQMMSRIYRAEPLAREKRARAVETPSVGRQSSVPVPPENPRQPSSSSTSTMAVGSCTAVPGKSLHHLIAVLTETGSSDTVTPLDGSKQPPPAGSQEKLSWDDYASSNFKEDLPWCCKPCAEQEGESMREAAIRMVNSEMAYTRQALVLRIVRGDLGHDKPLLDVPGGPCVQCPTKKRGSHSDTLLPSIVITANGTRFPGTTRFGRTTSQSVLLPDQCMNEAIASRSHFNIVYDEQLHRYLLMDTGSKSGTFMKIGERVSLSCGDWIRAGDVEFIIRYCGGGGHCKKRHDHYRLHSLRVSREHLVRRSVFHMGTGTGQGEDADEDEVESLPNELMLLLSGMRQAKWTSDCQQGRMLDAGLPDQGSTAERILVPEHEGQDTSMEKNSTVKERRQRCLATQVPVAPLELEFMTGPRRGERLVIYEKVATIGRGESSSIQVNDPQVSNISRIHCILDYVGDRWHIRDNDSTNGTWRRLSCVLQPSVLSPLSRGASFLAGTHEFQVEEAELPCAWTPSLTSEVLQECCGQEANRHRRRV
jgi:pSer/pThr/pTyr-binding forkhead associated (FHA) protein